MKEIRVKINKTESCFFEKKTKFTNPQPDSSRKKIEKNQINKIRNEKGEVATDNEEIQRLVRGYYEQVVEIKQITWKKWTDS